jgi:hypothetical protein
MNDKAPRSFHEKTGGMMYFPRMLDKMRLFAKGELREDCHANLGAANRADGLCCRFLRVSYEALKERALDGGTDEEILEWCFATGRRLDETDILIWNEFMRKRGWNDEASGRLAAWKQESGHADRADLMTMPDYTDVLEGRKP